jgi:hypothetical protein
VWCDGDFNYDGIVDSLDVADFLASNLFDAGSYQAARGSVAAVPEPTVAVLVGVAAGLTAVAVGLAGGRQGLGSGRQRMFRASPTVA